MSTKQDLLQHKVCMVTGANAGIGRYTALALAQMGATVVMVCRSSQRGKAARDAISAKSGNPNVTLLVADLSSQQDIRDLASRFQEQYDRLDVLVNNAGGTFVQRLVTTDGMEMNFGLNHLGYFLLTHLLLDTLKSSAPARIINVASSAHQEGTINFDDLQSENGYSRSAAYAQSKLANILFTYELARHLEGSGVTANCVHPGVVDTNFGGPGRKARMFARRILTPGRYREMNVKTAPEGAETLIYLASSPEVEGISGQYFVDKQPHESSPESHNQDVAQRLWKVSLDLTGLSI